MDLLKCAQIIEGQDRDRWSINGEQQGADKVVLQGSMFGSGVRQHDRKSSFTSCVVSGMKVTRLVISIGNQLDFTLFLCLS